MAPIDSLRPEAAEPSVDLHHLIEILLTRKWTILLITSLVVACALVFSYQQTPLYQAEARILLEPLPSAPTQDAPLEPVVVSTESQLVASQPVAGAVVKHLKTSESASALLKDLTVAGGAATATAPVPLGSQVLVVTYTSPDAHLARDAANAFASEYIKYRGRRALRQVADARGAAERSIQSASNEIVKLSDQIKTANAQQDGSLASTLETQRNALYSRLGVLQQRLDDLQPTSSARSGGAVLINSAELPTSPASPNHLINALLALFVGLGLAVATSLLRERLDKRFKGRADVERTLQSPVLATIPAFGDRKGRSQDFQVVTLAQPKGAASEAYRSLRTNLQYTAIQRGIKSLLVTSAVPGEGKTVTTVNLAVTLAHIGQRVIVVSADLRRPTLERYFNLDKGEGLSSWLVSDDHYDPWRLIQDPRIPNLRVLRSGPIPNNPAELLTSSKLSQLVDLLTNNADMVLFDSAPVLGLADASILASRVDGTVLIVDATKSQTSATARAKQEIERAGGSVVGCLLNAFDPSASSYYNDSSYYYYGHYESEAEKASSNGGAEGRPLRGSERSKSRFSLRR